LESNFSKFEKTLGELREKDKEILVEIDNWLERVGKKMDSFDEKGKDSNYIAFEMLEDKDTAQDIIRVGESLLDRLHAESTEPSPEVQ